MMLRSLSAVAIVTTLLAACRDYDPAKRFTQGLKPNLDFVVQPLPIRLEQVGERFETPPVYATSPPGDARLFVVEQSGVIRILRKRSVVPRPFLDIRSRVLYLDERGMFSMVFDPGYSSNGFFYVDYIDRNGNTRVERYTVSNDADVADTASHYTILVIPQREGAKYHKGGLLLFGPDSMLYVATGDGGLEDSTSRNAQDPTSLSGKLLRIDVRHGAPYTIPSGNPFKSGKDGRPEIWAMGLRNPWRYSFDKNAGLLYVADLGQLRHEEINVVAANRPGVNYGWDVMEGGECYQLATGRLARQLTHYRLPCWRAGLEMPAVTLDRTTNICGVIGGLVYTGRSIPELRGQYVFGDYCGGPIRSFRYQNGRVTEQKSWFFRPVGRVLSFGEDGNHEAYILGDFGVFRLAGRGSNFAN